MAGKNAIGLVSALRGEALATGGSGSRTLAKGASVFEGETVVTKAGAAVEITFTDKTVLSQGEKSEIKLDSYVFDGKSDPNLFFKMTEGTFRVITGKIVEQNPERFKLGSPLATIGIRGTTTLHEMRGGTEKHGVEDLHGSKAMVLQSLTGEIQSITQPGFMARMDSRGTFTSVGPSTPEERRHFQTTTSTQPTQNQTDDPQQNQPGDGSGGEGGQGGEGQGGEGQGGSAGEQAVQEGANAAAAGVAAGPSVVVPTGLGTGTGVLGVGVLGQTEPFGQTGITGLEQEVKTGETRNEGDPFGDGRLNPEVIKPVQENADRTDKTDPLTTSSDIPPDLLYQTPIQPPPAETVATPAESAPTPAPPPAAPADATITGTSGDDNLTGTSANETYFVLAGNDTVHAGSGDDVLIGDAGNDYLYGEDGNDTLQGGMGTDYMDGGLGVNTVDFSDNTATLNIILDAGVAGTGLITDSWGNVDTLVSIRNIIGSNFGDQIQGDDAANRIQGGSGADYILGQGGDDTVLGGAGDDMLLGLAGNDTVVGADGIDFMAGHAGNDVISGGLGMDTVGYESATMTGVVVDLAVGASNDGEGGSDTFLEPIENVVGSDFNDTLTGAAGLDNAFYASDGTDTVTGNAGDHDILSFYKPFYNWDYTSVSVNFGTGTVTHATGTTSYTNIAEVYGGDFNDTFNGSGSNDTANGGMGQDNFLFDTTAGDDNLDGGLDNDTFNMGSNLNSLDTLNGGDGSDFLEYTFSAPGDLDHVTSFEQINVWGASVVINAQDGLVDVGSALTVNKMGGGSLTWDGSFETDGRFLLNGEAGVDTLIGGAGYDSLYGNGGNDILIGNGGNDLFDGNVGNDTATGGAGDDTFRFALYGAANADVITDFNNTTQSDKIAFSGAAFGGVATGVLTALRFYAGAAATSTMQRFVYDAATGHLSYDSDGSGANTAQVVATVNTTGAGHPVLAVTDFQVY